MFSRAKRLSIDPTVSEATHLKDRNAPKTLLYIGFCLKVQLFTEISFIHLTGREKQKNSDSCKLFDIPINNQAEAIMQQRGGGEEFERYSVYVDNVDYWCTSRDLKSHFECCGTVNRITIPTNEFGSPQGYAYVEFADLDSVDKALLLNGSNLRSQEITVSRKKKRPSWNNNSTRGFRRPIQQQQQQQATTSRSAAGNSNRSSRTPSANYRNNNNRPIQQQQAPRASSSNSRFSYTRPIGLITNTTSAVNNNNGNINNSNRPFQQQQPPANSRNVGGNHPAYPNTNHNNNNRPMIQQRRQQPPPSSSSNSRFSYVRPIGITTTTSTVTSANNENTNNNIQATQNPNNSATH